MSNIIPIVSSSPPPLEDDAAFGWGEEDDDDEFGNFASAPVADDNSFEVNWSNSDASIPSPAKDSDTSRNSEETLTENGCDGIKEKDLKESSILCKEVGKIPTDINSPESGFNNDQVESTADNVENGDFAHFDDNQTSENISPSPSSQLQSPNKEPNNKDINTDAVTLKSDSSQEFNSSCPDQCSDNLATDSETASSSVLKNNESLYSNASTIDSGVFSADMSPCSHPNSTSDLCQTIDKEEDSTLELKETNEKNDASVLESVSGSGDKELTSQAPEDQTLESKSSSLEHHSPPEDTENDAEDDDWCDFNSAVTDDSHATVVESEQKDKTNSSSAVIVETGHHSTEDGAHSSSQNETEKSDHSSITTHTPSASFQSESVFDSSSPDTNIEENINASVNAVDDSPGHLVNDKIMVDEKDPVIDVDNEKKPSDNTAKNLGSENEESKVEDDFEKENVDETEWANFSSAVNEEENESNAEGEDSHLKSENLESEGVKLKNGKSDLNDTLTVQDEPEITNPEVVNECKNERENTVDKLDDIQRQKQYEKDLRSDENNCGEDSTQDNLPEGESKDEAAEKDSDSGAEEDDIEFGDFGSHRQRKESDPHEEVAPITFRTSVCEPDLEENEDDFSSGKEMPPEDDCLPDIDSANQETGSDYDDDDFGDFDSALKPKPDNFSSGTANDEGADDFGDFGSTDTAGDESGWADFGSAAPAVESNESDGFGAFKDSPQTLSSVESQQDKTLKLVLALASCFPESVASSSLAVNQTEKDYETSVDKSQEEAGEEKGKIDNESSSSTMRNDETLTSLDTVVELGLSKALEAKQQTWTVVQHPSKKDPKVRLWGHLKDFDSSHALEYGWPTSYCSKEIFNTLHIDTQNVLFTQKKQAVPFFASGLTILEPTRGGGDGKKEKNHQPQLQPTLVDTSKHEPQQTTPQDIPPVDFDWSVSGLTNPLTANTLDLDFLVVQGSDSCEKTSDEWAWVFKADQQDATTSGLQPLEEILKKSTPTAKLTTHEVLSPEALRILEKMPNLSFMQSRVLMFPVKQ